MLLVSNWWVQTIGWKSSFPSSADLLWSMRYWTSCPLWLKNLISLGIPSWANWWPFRSFNETFLLNRSGKAKFSPGVKMNWRLVKWVMITWNRKKRWDNHPFRAYRFNSGSWSQKILIGCGQPMMKCSLVCRADMIPQSSRCKVDIFCSFFEHSINEGNYTFSTWKLLYQDGSSTNAG